MRPRSGADENSHTQWQDAHGDHDWPDETRQFSCGQGRRFGEAGVRKRKDDEPSEGGARLPRRRVEKGRDWGGRSTP
jgi:hypothetical protein